MKVLVFLFAVKLILCEDSFDSLTQKTDREQVDESIIIGNEKVFIQLPGWPDNYNSTASSFRWHILGGSTKSFRVRFSEPYDLHGNDTLRIFDGRYTVRRCDRKMWPTGILALMSTRGRPEIQEFVAKSIIVEFCPAANASVSRLGFQMSVLGTNYTFAFCKNGILINKNNKTNTCNITLTEARDTAEIASPGWPHAYEISAAYRWVFESSTIQLFTVYFSTRFATQANYDFVRIVDGAFPKLTICETNPSHSTYLLRQYSGIGPTSVSTESYQTNRLIIDFCSGLSIVSTGFQLAVSRSEIIYNTSFCYKGSLIAKNVCLRTVTSETLITLRSPGHPGSYKNGQKLRWIIQTSFSALYTLRFGHFDLESGKDFVKFLDGDEQANSTACTGSTPILAMYTSDKSAAVDSSPMRQPLTLNNASTIIVDFCTDHMFVGNGFYLFVGIQKADEMVRSFCEDGNIVNGTGGVCILSATSTEPISVFHVQSPGWPYWYRNDDGRRWILKTPKKNFVYTFTLNFTDGYDFTDNDTLTLTSLYEMPPDFLTPACEPPLLLAQNTQRQVLTGNSSQTSMTLFGKVIVIEFCADRSHTARGFSLLATVKEEREDPETTGDGKDRIARWTIIGILVVALTALIVFAINQIDKQRRKHLQFAHPEISNNCYKLFITYSRNHYQESKKFKVKTCGLAHGALLLQAVEVFQRLEKLLACLQEKLDSRLDIGDLTADLPVDEQIEKLRWKPDLLELPTEWLNIAKTELGRGTYGKVSYGVLKLPDDEEGLEVAVKRPLPPKGCSLKEQYGDEHFKALIVEIKILSHLSPSSSINVICFYGAVTKFLANGELLAVVEYCRHGSLLSFLRQHRFAFSEIIDEAKSPSMFETNKALAFNTGPYSLPVYGGDKVVIGTSKSLEAKVLSDRVSGYFYLTNGDLLSYAYQIAAGMDFLASKNVVHRDLSARNVLLADDYVIKIVDFGLSRNKAYFKINENAQVPLKWTAIESLEYGHYTTKSDIWSFGVVLYELFSLGEVPYAALPNDPDTLLNFLKAGNRLRKPTFACEEISALMNACFVDEPSRRPTFADYKHRLADHYRNLFSRMYANTMTQLFAASSHAELRSKRLRKALDHVTNAETQTSDN